MKKLIEIIEKLIVRKKFKIIKRKSWNGRAKIKLKNDIFEFLPIMF